MLQFSSTQTKKKVIYNRVKKLSEITFENLCSDNFTIMFFEIKKEISECPSFLLAFFHIFFENLIISMFKIHQTFTIVSACKAGSYVVFF